MNLERLCNEQSLDLIGQKGEIRDMQWFIHPPLLVEIHCKLKNKYLISSIYEAILML